MGTDDSRIARLDGAPPVEIVLRRSSRARRFSLRVSRFDGRVTLTLPPRAQEREALAFARGQEAWIRATLAALPGGVRARPGETIPIGGQPCTIVAGRVRTPRLGDGVLDVPAGAKAGPRVAAFLKDRARVHLTSACDRYAAGLGRDYTALVLRDTRSRWGSCSSAGRLMFSWRLAMAPPAVLDYVAAHEVAHLAEMNHSAAFWRHVDRLCPGWRAQRDWLRTHGAMLHRVDFGAA